MFKQRQNSSWNKLSSWTIPLLIFLDWIIDLMFMNILICLLSMAFRINCQTHMGMPSFIVACPVGNFNAIQRIFNAIFTIALDLSLFSHWRWIIQRFFNFFHLKIFTFQVNFQRSSTVFFNALQLSFSTLFNSSIPLAPTTYSKELDVPVLEPVEIVLIETLYHCTRRSQSYIIPLMVFIC